MSIIDNILRAITGGGQQKTISPIGSGGPSPVVQRESGPPAAYYKNPTAYPKTTAAINSYNNSQVLGANTGGGGYTPPAAGDVGQAQVDQAQKAKQSQLDSIMARVNLLKDIASRNIGRAGDVRNEIVQRISDTYRPIYDAAQVKLDSSLQNLATEDTNVQNVYGRAAGNARRAMEGAVTRNRNLARAMNRLNSSFYDDRQAGVAENTARAVSDIGTEEAGKRAGIETRKTETKNWFDQETVRIKGEEAGLKSQAEREYQDQVNAANDMERSFGIDATEDIAAAEDRFQSRLDSIQNYIENKSLRLAEIATTGGASLSGINSFEAINPTLQATLSNDSGLTGADAILSNLPTFNSPSSYNIDPLAFVKGNEDNQSTYAQILARLDPRRAAALGLSSSFATA